jgi:DNA-binding transcriptional MerR regulator
MVTGESPFVEVTSRTGLPVKTIRFERNQGLPQARARSAGGYRLFAEENLPELPIIRALQATDGSIAEMARILEVRLRMSAPVRF